MLIETIGTFLPSTGFYIPATSSHHVHHILCMRMASIHTSRPWCTTHTDTN